MIAQSDTTQWPEAAIAIAGILPVVAITVVGARRPGLPHERARTPHQDGRVADSEKSTSRLLYSLRGSVP